MFWSRQTKTKRGDQLAGRNAVINASQFCRVQNRFLFDAITPLPESGPLFPGLTAGMLMGFLRWLCPSPPPGYRLAIHGLRAGTATTLAAMRVPLDVLRAWGWWASPHGTDTHYAAFVTSTMRLASALLHLVLVSRLRPGFVEFLGLDGGIPLPRWTNPQIHAAAVSIDHVAGPLCRLRGEGETDSSSEDPAVVLPAGILDLDHEARPPPPARLPRVSVAQAGLLSAGNRPAMHSAPLLAGLEDRLALPATRDTHLERHLSPSQSSAATTARPRPASAFGSALVAYSRSSAAPTARMGGSSASAAVGSVSGEGDAPSGDDSG
jgi:hypothetical protein